MTREEYVAWQKAIASPTPAWMLDVIASNLGSAAAHAAHHAALYLNALNPHCWMLRFSYNFV